MILMVIAMTVVMLGILKIIVMAVAVMRQCQSRFEFMRLWNFLSRFKVCAFIGERKRLPLSIGACRFNHHCLSFRRIYFFTMILKIQAKPWRNTILEDR